LNLSPFNPTAGQEVNFGATVSNHGNAPTPNGAAIQVIYQVDGQTVSWTANQWSPSLAPGNNMPYLWAGSGPNYKATWTATPGVHVIKAWVNQNGTIKESNTNNNTFVRTVMDIN
jgi:hypothetical protein